MNNSINITQNCRILVGAPASGKTKSMLAEMTAQTGRYLLAAPRRDLIEDHVNWLQTLAASHGTKPTLHIIHSDQSAREPVGRRVAEALKTYDAVDHVILAITHEALMALDGSALTSWHVRIDEIPDGAIVSAQVSLPTSWPAMAAHYTLERSQEPAGMVIRLRPDVKAPTLSAITEDVGEKLVSLHRAIATPTRTVTIDIENWKDASLARRRVNWWSIWSLDVLVGCQSIVLTSASYIGSLFQRVTERSTRTTVSLEAVSGSARTGILSIRLHYYTRHPGSTSWWKTDDGSRCLVQISRHLERISFCGYWSCNDDVLDYFRNRFDDAVQCAPKQAGSNSLRQHAACAMIYSNKAQASDEPIIDLLGLDQNDIRAAREDEDIYQFVLRGALRDANYHGVYDIHVYDQDQAERLKNRLEAQNYGDIVLVPVDAAGIMDVVRPQPTCKKTETSVFLFKAEQSEQKRQKERERGRRRRQTKRDRDQSEGKLRKPGRPRKLS